MLSNEDLLGMTIMELHNFSPKVVDPQINPEELQEYSLIGFGSGIYGDKHHKALLDLADKLPPVTNRKAFIFSTSGMT
jgi:hypothetical protein